MDSDFCVTHVITFRPTFGPEARYEVMLDDEGRAYTREEWEACEAADWTYDADAGWRCLGQATPGGQNGEVEILPVGGVGGGVMDALAARVESALRREARPLGSDYGEFATEARGLARNAWKFWRLADATRLADPAFLAALVHLLRAARAEPWVEIVGRQMIRAHVGPGRRGPVVVQKLRGPHGQTLQPGEPGTSWESKYVDLLGAEAMARWAAWVPTMSLEDGLRDLGV